MTTKVRGQPSRVERVHNLGAWALRLFLVIVLSFMWLVELNAHTNYWWVNFVFGIPGLCAIVTVWVFRPSRKYLVAFIAAISLLSTGIIAVAGPGMSTGLGEIGALLVLLAWGIRDWRVPPGPWVPILVAVALLATSFRHEPGVQVVQSGVLMMFPFMVAVGIGVYLYIIDSRRNQAMSEARDDERLEMAREIHDFVAHHVTGIVVRAQAAQFAASDNPQASREAFAEIEQAGSQALVSMRSMVAMLRNTASGSQLRPLGDIGQIPDMVERFNSSDLSATCYLSPQLRPMAAEVEATIFRLVQESLTNVNKHARSATTVRVVVAPTSQGVEVSVRDNGSGKDTKVFAKSGFGLVGISERVDALGGELRFGPRDANGWEVSAYIPTAAPN